MANISNLFVDQGSDYTTIITVLSQTGAPLNLANHIVRSQMRKAYQSSLAYTLTAEVFNAEAGQILLSLTAAQSEAIPAGRWLYDVEITNTATGAKRRVVEGIIDVSPQITQI